MVTLTILIFSGSDPNFSIYIFAVHQRADLCKYCDLNKKPRDVQVDVINRAMQHLLKTFGIKAQESESKKGGVMSRN